MPILTVLQQHTNFTVTEQRIAAYVLDHLDTLPQMLIKELAAATYTSHSAIIRLAQKLGYHGYRDFQLAITTAAAQRQADPVDANFPFDATDTPATITQKIADLNVTAIQSAQRQLDLAALTAIASTLTHARRIFLFSQGDSQLRARSFQNKLVKIGRFAIIAEEYADQAWNASKLTPDDCAFFISYAGTTKEHVQFATYLHERRVPTIVLTGNPQSPLLPVARHQLVSIQDEGPFAKIGTFASQAAFEYVLDTLFATIYAQDLHHHLTDLRTNQRLMQGGPLATK